MDNDIFTGDWTVVNSDMFKLGVNTLLFHQYGIHGYYGKFAMVAINLAGSAKQRELNDSPMKIAIKKYGKQPYEKFRCDCYRNGIIADSKDIRLCDSFDEVFKEISNHISSKVKNKKEYWFEDNFEKITDGIH